jgi:hypothetical protein
MDAVGRPKSLNDTVARVLRAVRSFGKADEDRVDEDVKYLRSYLTNRNEGAILKSTLDLKAVSLIFDYEDSQGLPFTPTISEIGKVILRKRSTTIQQIFEKCENSASRMKWMRQVIWVMLANALWYHRQNKLHQMGVVLVAARELLDKNLLREAERPGTLARWNYYRGLQLRDQGDLESAMEHFVLAFQNAQDRRIIKSDQHRKNPPSKEDFAAEDAFTRACLARIQAFGFGEVAFFRGDLTGSSAWFKTALMTLEGDGLERWKLSVRVYLEGARILISPFTAKGAERLRSAVQILDELTDELTASHRGYADLSRAFANLGRVRLEQMRCIELGSDTEALQVDLDEFPVPCQATALAGEDTVAGEAEPHGPHGAISALISLISGEVLLRCKRIKECDREIRWIRKQFVSNVFAQIEADLLEAQLLMVNNEWGRAARILEKDRNLDHRANRNQRALWLALASTVQFRLRNSLSARILAYRARSAATRAGDGFIRHFVQLAVSRVLPESTSILPMPYQGEPQNLSLKENRDAAVRNLIQTVLYLHDSVKSPEELAPYLELSTTALYDQVGIKMLSEFFPKKQAASKNPGS